MVASVFRTSVPVHTLLDFLIAVRNNERSTDSTHVLDIMSYKRGQCTGRTRAFLENCAPHYHLSTLEYVAYPTTHKALMTVVRQICNYHHIPYVTRVEYSYSVKNVVYTIDLDPRLGADGRPA